VIREFAAVNEVTGIKGIRMRRGGAIMLVSTIVVAAVGIVLERAVELQYGLPGLIGLLIMRTGFRKRNVTCTAVGVTVLVTLAVSAL
jgi:hypothetical protein